MQANRYRLVATRREEERIECAPPDVEVMPQPLSEKMISTLSCRTPETWISTVRACRPERRAPPN